MDPVVVPEGGERPAAPASPLADLRSRKTKILESLFNDLKVPRWDDDGGPAVYVRYKPASATKIASAMDRRSKQKKILGDDWIIAAQADVLIDSCVGVYAVDGDEKYSFRPDDPFGSWTRFDPDLAASLGLSAGEGGKPVEAVDVVRALYLTDGDLTLAYNSLCQWSGTTSEEAEEAHQGN